MKTLLEQLLDNFEYFRGLNSGKEIDYVYENLLKIALIESPDLLEQVYEDWKNYKEDNEWFRLFHKSIRQCDLYRDFGINIIVPSTITPEEEQRVKELTEYLNSIRPERDTNEYQVYFENNKTLIREHLDLLDKRRRKVWENISGYLDMILYGLIRADEDNRLFEILKNLFTYKDNQ